MPTERARLNQILEAVAAEVVRAEALHDDEDTLTLGTGGHGVLALRSGALDFSQVDFQAFADSMRASVEVFSKVGGLTWAAVLLEEVGEALVETDGPALQTELIQVAALAVRMANVAMSGRVDPDGRPPAS